MPNCSRICSMTLAVFALRSMWNTSVSGTVSGHPATTQLAVSAAEMSLRYLVATRSLYSPAFREVLLHELSCVVYMRCSRKLVTRLVAHTHPDGR